MNSLQSEFASQWITLLAAGMLVIQLLMVVEQMLLSTIRLFAMQSLMLGALAGGRAAPLLIVANAAAIALCRVWFPRRLGGITGDCMGFQCQVSTPSSVRRR